MVARERDRENQVTDTPAGTGFALLASGAYHSLALIGVDICSVVFCDDDGNNLGDVSLGSCDCSNGSIPLDLSTGFVGQFTYPLHRQHLVRPVLAPRRHAPPRFSKGASGMIN